MFIAIYSIGLAETQEKREAVGGGERPRVQNPKREGFD